MSRKFSPTFKKQTAELVTVKGYTYAQACAASGVGDTALRRWVHQLQTELSGTTPDNATAMTAEHLEIQRLRARIRDLEEDKEILKKATALLMSDARIGKKS